MRSRILYWFRTPPGVRVGRAALDEDAIRLIEEHNPDVEFDWTRILKGQDDPEPPPPRPQAFDRKPRPQTPRQETAAVPAPPSVPAAAPSRDDVAVASEHAAPLDVIEPATEPGPLEEPPVLVDEPVGPAMIRLGSEGMSRLRARHAEVLARISERITDPARRDELKSEADRLNPDTWVTGPEVTAGIEHYESVFESLRGVLGRGRKRRRRRGGGEPSGTIEQPAAEASPDESSGDGPDAEDHDKNL